MTQTDRLYYDQPSLRAFDATVVRVEPQASGTAVWLDRTAFYPTSGGQPFDTGVIEGRRVTAVEDDEDGGVRHVVEGSPLTTGSTVRGEIDWPRRFDHMQQHTGQHVLSAVLERAFGARTVSFHLGSECSTVDIDRELTAAQIATGELQANEVIWADLPVTIRYATADEARALPLRKEPARAGVLRLIDIEGVDLSACGGTHVARTGSLGQVSIIGWERFKGGQRLEFACGGRAVSRFQLLRGVMAATTRLLSVLPADVPTAIDRLLADAREQKRSLTDLTTELARYQGERLADEAEAGLRCRYVLRAVDGDAAQLKTLASAVAARPGVLAVLVSRSTPALAVAARAADIDGVACNEVIATLAKEFGGRGGGRPDMAQCGGLQASPESILERARSLVTLAR